MHICVYCASSIRIPQIYIDTARALGLGLAQRGWGLVYGGGSVGLMGVIAEAVQAAGGKVVGVIPQGLLDRELAYLSANDLIVTTTLRERKQIMEDRADAFIALSGGFGTFEELLEIITLRQLGYHNKPIFIVNTADYYNNLLAQFERCFAEGFAGPIYREMYQVVENIDQVLELLGHLNAQES